MLNFHMMEEKTLYEEMMAKAHVDEGLYLLFFSIFSNMVLLLEHPK